MAVSTAGANPPTRATRITTIRNISTSLVRLTPPRRAASSTVSTGKQRGGQQVPGDLPPQRDRAARPRQAPTAAHLRVGHDVHVDVAGAADGPGADAGPGEHGGQPRPAAGPQHQLGGVLRPGEGQQGLGDVVADDLVIGAAHRLDQPPLGGQRGRIGAGQAVGLGDVHGQQVAARGPGGDPGRPPDQRLALGPAGQRDHHPLPGLPGALDLVLDAVPLQALVHLVGQPEQRELAQRGEVPGAEVVGQRRVDLLRRVDVAVRHPAAQRLGRHVDHLDLVGGADDGVGHGLPLRHPGDLLDHVVEGFQVLDVDRGDHVDPGVEQFLHVLPALLVARSGHVGVRELVHQGDLRDAGRAPRPRPSPRRSRRGTPACARGTTSRPSSSALVCGRPCGSANPTTTSAPRSARRCPSPSMA